MTSMHMKFYLWTSDICEHIRLSAERLEQTLSP